eukprot:scaffold93823_cov32-Prasinocladus_malaysianus.AAC.1
MFRDTVGHRSGSRRAGDTGDPPKRNTQALLVRSGSTLLRRQSHAALIAAGFRPDSSCAPPGLTKDVEGFDAAEGASRQRRPRLTSAGEYLLRRRLPNAEQMRLRARP